MIIEPTIPERLDLFSAFRHTLSSLHLKEISITWSTLLSLVGYFPDLRNLEISLGSFEVDDRPAPHPSHALCGRLSLWTNYTTPACKMVALVDRLADLKLEYEEVVLGEGYESRRRMLALVQKTIKILTMTRGLFLFKLDLPLDLSHCTELQEIHIRAIDPEENDVALIPSITSTNLQKITLRSFSCKSLLSKPIWPHFDGLVCELVDKLCLLGYQRTLEVEVSVLEWISSKERTDVQEFLPKFRDKGRVRILEDASGEWHLLS